MNLYGLKRMLTNPMNYKFGGHDDQAPYEFRVLASGERRQSIDDTLEAGGWITCGHALKLARQLGIPSLQFGALLDLLEIKVRECSLGCFK